MSKISIVMTYHNRPYQLLTTLKSIKYYYGSSVEIIIVDDASDDGKQASNVLSSVNGLDVKLTAVDKSQKWWINPCIPFNMGLKLASGDIIMIQNSECIHVGDLIGYSRSHINSGSYLTFSCYSLTKGQYPKILSLIKLEGQSFMDGVKGIINPLVSQQWLNHPQYRPVAYHFTSVITRSDLNIIGGFNEDFADGYCFEDNELLLRIKRLGMSISIIPPEDGFVVHQWHEKSYPMRGGCPEWHKNKARYERLLNDQ